MIHTSGVVNSKQKQNHKDDGEGCFPDTPQTVAVNTQAVIHCNCTPIFFTSGPVGHGNTMHNSPRNVGCQVWGFAMDHKAGKLGKLGARELRGSAYFRLIIQWHDSLHTFVFGGGDATVAIGDGNTTRVSLLSLRTVEDSSSSELMWKFHVVILRT